MVYNLISSPRNLSTALMYFFHHRGDMLVFDEPYYAYYLSKSNKDHPGKVEILNAMEKELDSVKKGILQEQSSKAHVFIKNMAHHLIDMDWSFMKDFYNILLIRDPKQLIASFAQVIPNPQAEDIGIKRQYDILQELKRWDRPFVVIDSGDILKDPHKAIEALCEQLEISYNDKMISWPKGAIPRDGVWAKYWYKNVHQSTGFTPQKTSTRPLPDSCLKLYEESLPYYTELSKYVQR